MSEMGDLYVKPVEGHAWPEVRLARLWPVTEVSSSCGAFAMRLG